MSHQDDVYVRNFGSIKQALENQLKVNNELEHKISGLQNLIVQQEQKINDMEMRLNVLQYGKTMGSTVHG